VRPHRVFKKRELAFVNEQQQLAGFAEVGLGGSHRIIRPQGTAPMSVTPPELRARDASVGDVKSGLPSSVFTSGRLLIILAPVLALVGATALMAFVAWLAGWYRHEMLLAAIGAGGIVVVVTIALLYGLVRQQRASNLALQSAEARVSGIVESAMDPIITVDEEQRILLFNAAAEQVFRWPRAAVIGQPLDKLLPQRFHGIHRSHIERFGLIGTTSRKMGAQSVLVALRADGQEFPIEASISQHNEFGKKRFTVILRDITERVRAERLVEGSEARLRGILDSAMDAIITVDADQHIVMFNAAAEAMFGCPQAEAIGAPLSWFIPERFRKAHTQHVRGFGEGSIVSRRMGALRIVTGLRRDGQEFPIDASISQLSERDGKFYTVILRDVSARVEAEEALRRSKDELHELASAAHRAREQEKSRIARELHDELGQSLTALQMDVAWCRERVAEGNEGMAMRLARMESLLETTVAATRRISADLRPLMLDDLGLWPALEWLVESFTEHTGVQCELSMKSEEIELPDLQATAVFRAVQESLTNIAKHARASRVDVTIERENSTLAVSVRDDGVGFSAEDSRKPNSFGLLGLRERAALLGGEASVTSAPGRGTRVEVRFPVAQEVD
jgi:PAS domain S-box-containing protein